MSTELTQEIVNESTEHFKAEILKMAGCQRMEMAMMMNSEVRKAIAIYTLEIVPAVESHGFIAPSANDIFGINVEITEH